MSLFSKKLSAADKASSNHSVSSSAAASSSGKESKPWFQSVPSVRMSFKGGVEFVVELSPSLCAMNAKYDKERKANRPVVSDDKKSTRYTGVILGFVGTSTNTSFVIDRGNACVLLSPKNSGSKVFRVGDKFTFTVWGNTSLDTSGIVKVRAYANPNKDYKMTDPNQFSGHSESVTYVGTSDPVKIVPAKMWNDRQAYELARLMGCTLRPLNPSLVPSEAVWSAYADQATGGGYSSGDNGVSADEMAARAVEMHKKLEGKSDEERNIIITASNKAAAEEQKVLTKEMENLKKSALKEAWKNAIPLEHPLSLWRNSFFPAFAFETPGLGEMIGSTTPIVATSENDAYINPSDGYFTDHPDMPYDSKIEVKNGKQEETKIPIMPHVCIEIAQQIMYKAPLATEDEVDALGIMYMLWSTKLAPLMCVREPHTLFNLAKGHFASFKMHICAQTDVEKTIKGFPGEDITSKNDITGRPWSVVHMDVFEMQSSPVDFMLSYGYELNSKAVIYVMNLFLAAIGENIDPFMLDTGCFNESEPTDPEKATCDKNYRRVLAYISKTGGGNSSRVSNMFETGGQQRVWHDGMPSLNQSDAFFLVPMRQFAPGEFGYGPQKANTEANLRKLYREVYEARSKTQEDAVKPADGISERVMSGDSTQFALPPVFAADGWAVNFTIFQVPRSVLRPTDLQHKTAQETTATFATLINEARNNSPHAESAHFNETVEEVFGKMQQEGKHFSVCSHRDVDFHQSLCSAAEHAKRRRESKAETSDKRQRTHDVMGDDEELDAAMLTAASMHAAGVSDDENEGLTPEQDGSIPVDTEYSDDENE